MSDWQLGTPVAFFVFNRPDTTARVFAEIARAKPPVLLIVADGPRSARSGEAEKCADCRRIVEAVDWPCQVITHYSQKNLGCKVRMSSGIDWVFEQVEEAIILEDDCLPDPSFFRFCEEMLQLYRHDKRIGMISGDNFFSGQRRNMDSYYFSKMFHIWGWASWRDRWQDSYDVDMRRWTQVREEGWLRDVLGHDDDALYWTKIFDSVTEGKVDTWDYQWVFANLVDGRLAIAPNVNLISNIGFGPEATHTMVKGELAELPTRPMEFPLRHPAILVQNAKFDRIEAESTISLPFFRRLRRYALRHCRRIFQALVQKKNSQYP